MATVHNRERGWLVLLALFLVSYHPFYSHTIVSNQTKKAFIYSRCLLSHLWTRKAKALQVWTKEDSNGTVELCRVQLHPSSENSIYFYFLRGNVGWGIVKCKHHQTLGRTKHYLHYISPTTCDICTYHCCTSSVITLCWWLQLHTLCAHHCSNSNKFEGRCQLRRSRPMFKEDSTMRWK